MSAFAIIIAVSKFLAKVLVASLDPMFGQSMQVVTA